MKVCAVTCTGGRPELFALCRHWVERQTRRPDHWLVVTDNGDLPDVPEWAERRRIGACPWLDKCPDTAPNHALAVALGLVPQDHAVVVFEDDDWYSDLHIDKMVRSLEAGADVTYGAYVIEYNVPRRMWCRHDKPGASEGRVGLAPSAISAYIAGLRKRPLYGGERPHLYAPPTTIGIKGVGFGLPGRPGATPPHGYTDRWTKDAGGDVLRSLVGTEDAASYFNLVSHGPSPTA